MSEFSKFFREIDRFLIFREIDTKHDVILKRFVYVRIHKLFFTVCLFWHGIKVVNLVSLEYILF